MPTKGTLDAQDALAGLRKWKLERDDSGPFRVYKNEKVHVFHSVTHILKETSEGWQKDALERWLERPNSILERDIACQRGNLTHSHAEYLLKTGAKLARQSANRKGCYRVGNDGLVRAPSKITAWALEKAAKNAPRVPWSAAGYARGLRSWILERVTAIHAVEFSIHVTPSRTIPTQGVHGFAGTCDALVDIDGVLTICDWKTSATKRSEELLRNYIHQLGAYSLGVKRNAQGLSPQAGAVSVARRSGPPQIRMLSNIELLQAEELFLERFHSYLQLNDAKQL